MKKQIQIKEEVKEMRKLVEAWEGHIINNTSCGDCKDKNVKCPIHKFFMKIKKRLKREKRTREVKDGRKHRTK